MPEAQLAVAVREKKPLETLPGVVRAIVSVERALGAEGRVLVRYSGTENKARVLVEGPDPRIIRREHAEAIAEELRRALG